MLKKLLIFITLSVPVMLAALPSIGGETAVPPHEKYEVVGDLDKAGKIRPIEVIKYFNYSCGHCYKFSKGEGRLRDNFGDRIRYGEVPIFWGKQTPYPAMAYYLAKKFGKGPEVSRAIFEANFEYGMDVFDPAILNHIIREHDLPTTIGGDDWVKSPELRDKVQKGIDMANKFNVNATPTIIINGAIKITPRHTDDDMTKMIARIEEIVVDLLTRDENN